ncbi:hypothetical protein CKO25_02440 [Thiocapsa imhoffii]|uniref:HAMP domain-containing protein n=1 Tax=Thiocapsa imhoffii TaxID=382777 RepID=A0A9X1B771_9GAMM|nr:hypothetical protein [Thiocapsa imhoffii]MBK1643534.1 hypothetical protein [Thiocapsa imhoffii]
MKTLTSRLRIGEKIALGFGLVILIFLGVILHDQRTLTRLAADYERLHQVFGARQSFAFGIARNMTAMRQAEASFRLHPELTAAMEVAASGRGLADETLALGRLDSSSARTATEIQWLTRDYLLRFVALLDAWVIRGLDENRGLQGQFRHSAHALEAAAMGLTRESWDTADGLALDILQLRRREKDYLLRGGDDYVAMVDQILAQLAQRLDEMRVPEIQGMLAERLRTYDESFHALVEQNRRIAVLGREMDAAAARITPLVEANLELARAELTAMTARWSADARAQGRLNLLIAFGATGAGLIFAVWISLRLARTLRRFARLLDRLVTETPGERIPVTRGARDEVELMARSLNTLADHKATFVDWWRVAMREAVALRDVNRLTAGAPAHEELLELRQAIAGRETLMKQFGEDLGLQLARVQTVVERLDCSQRQRPWLDRQDCEVLSAAALRLAVLAHILEADTPASG